VDLVRSLLESSDGLSTSGVGRVALNSRRPSRSGNPRATEILAGTGTVTTVKSAAAPTGEKTMNSCENCNHSLLGDEMREDLVRAGYEVVCCHPKNFMRTIFLSRGAGVNCQRHEPEREEVRKIRGR